MSSSAKHGEGNVLTETLVDLASHCRLLLHSRPKHTKFYRWGMLYPLYILAEGAIIATDLAELLGSAIALVLLFPRLPLWAGVLITGADVLLLLAMKDPLGGSPVKAFEFLIGGMVRDHIRPPDVFLKADSSRFSVSSSAWVLS